MKWLEISVTAGSEASEAVVDLFDRHVPGGAVLEVPVDCFEYELPAVSSVEQVVVKGYLPLDGTAQERRGELQQGLWLLQTLYPISELVVRSVAVADWAEAWKQHYHRLHIGRRIVIVPAWEEYTPIPDQVVIYLEPGMAFGTGIHATTRLCLEALETHLQPGATVLDVGTGSGVLSIAAAKLGACSVLALDADPVAVAVARENVGNNRVGDRITVRHGSLPGGQVPGYLASGSAPSLLDSGCFDLVLVNILAPVIVGMAPALAARLGPQQAPHQTREGPKGPGSLEPAAISQQGYLIVSGLIESQESEVVRALQAQGFCLIERTQQQDWVALVMRRR